MPFSDTENFTIDKRLYSLFLGKEGFQIVAINHFSFKTIKLKVFFSKFNRDFNVKRHNRITEQNAPEKLNNQLKQEVIIE